MGSPKNQEKKPFRLEVDDRTDEEREQAKEKDKGLWASALRMGASEKDRRPMDSEYQEDLEDTSPKIKINRNFMKWVAV